MKHAREDYNRIQDPEHKIPEDEPVFLLRAHDIAAPATVQFWANLARDMGANIEIVQLARKQAVAMAEWQRSHGKKVPDLGK